MKKFGLAFIALVAVGVIYYLTVGSTQIVTEIKKEINNEVVELEKSGFIIEEREIKEKSEHFVIDFNDTKSITKYIKKSSHSLSQAEVELLKGLKVAVDIEYTPTVKDAISFDIYPIKLPSFLYEEIKDDNKSIEAIDKMLKEKLILVHVNINKLLSGFDGYLKDIDTKFNNGDIDGAFATKGFTFNGDIQGEDIKNLQQGIQKISFKAGEEIELALSNIKLFVKNPIVTKYGNNSSNYTIESLNLKDKNSNNFSLIVNSISGSSEDIKKGELIDGIAKFTIASIDYSADNEKILVKNTNGDIKIENVNIDAMEELEDILDNDNASFEQMMPIIKKITKSDLLFNLSNLSLDSITNNGKELKGLKISALAKINKNFDWKGVDTDPMLLMQLGDIKANITLSDELFGVIAQDPNMMMVMMLTQPVDKNGTKVYDLEFTQGSFKVNGKPFM
jgi:hypothetical protein